MKRNKRKKKFWTSKKEDKLKSFLALAFVYVGAAVMTYFLLFYYDNPMPVIMIKALISNSHCLWSNGHFYCASELDAILLPFFIIFMVVNTVITIGTPIVGVCMLVSKCKKS